MSARNGAEMPRDRRELADEFVLGLLDADEQAGVEAAIESDPEMREAVAAARARFHELDDTAEPIQPSDLLWKRIENELDVDGRVEAEPAVTPVTAPAANDNVTRRWRLASFVAMAAVLVLAVGLFHALRSQPSPAVIAVLADERGEPVALVEDYGNRRSRVVTLADFDIPEDRDMQVWTLPPDGEAPVSLGIMDDSGTATLDYDPAALPAPQAGQLYEITLEPEGGSPTGGPTGAILGKGFAKRPR